MDLLAHAEHLIAAHPDRAERGAGWPCCEWVARLLLAAGSLEGIPQYRPGGPWWRRANIWEALDPFSSTAAVGELLTDLTGGTELALTVLRPQPDQRTALLEVLGQDPGTWWAVQGWRRLLPDGTADPSDAGAGHTFLVQALEGGQGRVLESSEREGVRFAGVPWRGGDLPAPEPLVRRLAPYVAGISVIRIWRDP